jgi:hypothetical protein
MMKTYVIAVATMAITTENRLRFQEAWLSQLFLPSLFPLFYILLPETSFNLST